MVPSLSFLSQERLFNYAISCSHFSCFLTLGRIFLLNDKKRIISDLLAHVGILLVFQLLTRTALDPSGTVYSVAVVLSKPPFLSDWLPICHALEPQPAPTLYLQYGKGESQESGKVLQKQRLARKGERSCLSGESSAKASSPSRSTQSPRLSI